MRNKIKNNIISIIVPLYKGNEYVDSIISMMKDNYRYCKLRFDIDVELVFVNDYPSEKIKKIDDEEIKIKLIQRKENGGIHVARIDGFKVSTGAYIVFFDQDDFVKEQWLYELLNEIQLEQCDAAVCNGWRSRYKYLYSMEKMYSTVNDLNFYLDYGNAIVSPGQVLIKRESIPKEWISNIKKINGCDDHLLWLIMLKKGAKYGIVKDYLYYHNPGRHSYSITQSVFYKSYKENIDILNKEHLLEKGEFERMQQMAEKFNDGTETRISVIELLTKMYLKRINGIKIADVLKKENVTSIAIYGVGMLGEIVIEDLLKSGIDISYIVDKNADDFFGQYKVISINDYLQKVDLIIDTTIDGIDKDEEDILRENNLTHQRIGEIIDKM